jgi:CHASE2 domain-containing sensor protein/signal transduction histidine kinase
MVATLALSGFSAVRELSDRMNDGLFRIRNYYTGPSQITVVVIDDASLAQDGRWPWPRGQLARLINAISASRPQGIGLDILLSEPSDASNDALLAGAIRQAGNVVLPAKLSTSPTGSLWIEPLPLFEEAAAGVGHVQAILDGDGVCRRLPDAEMSLHGAVLMMAKVLGAASNGTRRTPPEDTPLQFLQPRERTIDYRGLDAGDADSRPFQTISAAKILSGNPYSFSHRIVLIGFAGSGLEDELLTPLNYSSPAAGVLIQANMADTLSRSRSITSEPLAFQIPALLGICLLGSIAIRAHKGMRTAVWVLGAASVTYLTAYGIFFLWGIQFHLGLALLAELLVVPLGQLQHVLTLQTLIGKRLVHLQGRTQNLPLHIAGLLEHETSIKNPSKRTFTNAEWKLEVIARTEEQITIVSAFQQTLLHAMRDGIAVFAEGGFLMFHNPTWKAFLTLCRWTEESCWFDLQLALCPEGVEPMDSQGTSGMEKTHNNTTTGKEVLIADRLWRISLLKLPAFARNEKAVYMALCADLTPQMERDQAREQALQFITHELRTPLVSLQGFAELLQKFPRQAEAAGAADIIHRESERLVALTSMYLECLRLETTLPVLSPGSTDAETLMKRAASLAAPLCAASNKILTLTMPEERIGLYVDAAMIIGALLNLIANAVKYGADNAGVQALIQVSEERAILSICNEGNRIPDEELSRLFAPQYRMPENASGRTGWGIGLAFVKRVMEAHGGAVRVSSDEVETCFQLLIPLPGLSKGGAV